ncbi:MAG: DinB family protein [Gemmatales bacterium]|nr:DinB family protein [Gemmatales bacterium]MDW8386431.1 DinB family protein [Gemmatales bacterium]
MTTKDALLLNLEMGLFVLKSYVSDLSDADLLRRPAPKANHLAWQLGHLITSEHQIMNMIAPGSMPPLPPGFAENHDKAAAGVDDPARFLSKTAYLEIFDQQRAATKKALANLADADLDKPGPEPLRRVAPTVGACLVLVGNHPMMHAGQFAVVRRLLDKPILI